MSATRASRNPHLTPNPLPRAGEGVDSPLPDGERAQGEGLRFIYINVSKWNYGMIFSRRNSPHKRKNISSESTASPKP
jgi:hypothetical protein